MKKLLAIISILIFTSNIYVYADDEIEEIESKEVLDILETSSTVEDSISINSRAAVVIERSTHTILYGKNETQTRPMASTTKIMTRTSSS